MYTQPTGTSLCNNHCQGIFYMDFPRIICVSDLIWVMYVRCRQLKNVHARTPCLGRESMGLEPQ
jgi:hypothetical protein